MNLRDAGTAVGIASVSVLAFGAAYFGAGTGVRAGAITADLGSKLSGDYSKHADVPKMAPLKPDVMSSAAKDAGASPTALPTEPPRREIAAQSRPAATATPVPHTPTVAATWPKGDRPVLVPTSTPKPPEPTPYTPGKNFTPTVVSPQPTPTSAPPTVRPTSAATAPPPSPATPAPTVAPGNGNGSGSGSGSGGSGSGSGGNGSGGSSSGSGGNDRGGDEDRDKGKGKGKGKD